jgi:fido (protein-threonine AMPylation protein)
MGMRVVLWREVTPLEPFHETEGALLDAVDTLWAAWQRVVALAPRDELAEARRRSLRRHAIETGVVEHLYDIDWSVTEALVTSGPTPEATQAVGSIEPSTLAMIHSQLAALQYVAEVARERRPLSAQLVRDIHRLITRQQATYVATDLVGNRVEAGLRHGEWKRWPNHVRRPDGSLLQYTPPDQVEQQVQRLVELHGAMEGVHPVVRAAWLHHRFLSICPFEDGNGRVARALISLDLMRGGYAPPVVDRTRRDSYLAALDRANDGDLNGLVRLVAQLAIVAMRAELHHPLESSPPGDAVTVARAHVERIQRVRRPLDEECARLAEMLAEDVHERLARRLEELAGELVATFGEIDPAVSAGVEAPASNDARSTWWRRQLVRAAGESTFWPNLSGGAWWAGLVLTVLGRSLRYVAAIQRVGDGDAGVLAVTVFAELVQGGSPAGEDAGAPPAIPLIRLSSADSVTMVGGQTVDEVWPEVEELVGRTLAAAIHGFGGELG